MDSLTQIVLGAAAGEAVLGKKIGNKAMVWGAIGGTIPDLDVLGQFFLSNLDNIGFHRGISHSISFSIVGSVIFGWLVFQLYKWWYTKKPDKIQLATVRDWQWLFFWSLFTHPILDCFTMYGTELFAPFSDARIAWATISVADPLYTVPFLVCLLVAARHHKTSNKRRFWNYLGIGLSSVYLLFTVFNKQRVDRVFAQALTDQNIPVERFITNSTILNNVLWNCTAETKDHFYVAHYSLFDEAEISFSKFEKNHQLLKNADTDPTITALRWFTKDYFSVNAVGDQLQFNDLRFGTFYAKGDTPKDFVFRFMLDDQGEAGYHLNKTAGGPEPGEGKKMMSDLWTRIWGIKKGTD